MPKPSGIPMAATTHGSDNDNALEDRLQDLKAAVDYQEDYGKAIQLCEALLADLELGKDTSTTSRDNDNDNASLVAVVTEVYLKSLLHQAKFEQVIAKTNDTTSINSTTTTTTTWKVLQAYAYYRLEQYQQALHTVQQCTASNLAASLIEAQACFHGNQTDKALQLYQQLLDSTHREQDEVEEEVVELYTNAMAVLTANATPFVENTNTNTTKAHIITLTEKARTLLASTTTNGMDDYPYDLAYNLATHALLTADTAAKRHQALAILQQAQKQCQTIHAADAVQQLQKELKPLQLHAIWGKTLWGEPAATTTTTTTSTTTAATTKKNKATRTGNNTAKLNALLEESINPNLLSVIINNNRNKKTLSNLRQALESLVNVKAPWKLSALQTRLGYYNLAVVLLVQQEYQQSRETLQVLLQTLGSGPSSNSSKKKKKTTTTITSADNKVIPAWTEQDMIWWQVRIDVLMAYTYYWQHQQDKDQDQEQDDTRNTNKNVEKEFQDAVDKVQRRYEKLKDDNGSANANTKVYLELHLQQLHSVLKNGSTFQKDKEQQFQWLLQQMQQTKDSQHKQPHPAMIATLAKTFQDRNQPEKAKELLLSIGNNNNSSNSITSGNQIVAEMAMAQEQYGEAVELYEQMLQTDPNNNSTEVRARYVEALSHVDPQRAIQEWKKVSEDLDDSDEDDADDGQELELRELPRIKHHGDATATTAAGVAHAGNSTSNTSGRQPKNQEAVLRRRAKKREEYLQGLQQKGLYNPAKPTRPDPERWIPKHERQRNRRRNRNNQQHKGAQGGISNKDAAKLDVAARANASAANTASSGPSTAHLTVAGNSRKGGGRRR